MSRPIWGKVVKNAHLLIDELGTRMREWRASGDLSGPEAASMLAADLGRCVPWAELRDYEQALRIPDGPTAAAIAGLYGRSVEELFALSHLGTHHAGTMTARPLSVSVDDLASKGPSRAQATLWLGLGFEYNEALLWIELGWDLSEAAAWRAVEFAPEEASSWESVDCHPVEARELCSAMNAEEAIEWNRQGVPHGEWTAWRTAGLDPALAKAWREFNPSEAARLARCGAEPEEAREWRDREFNLDETIEWRAAVSDPEIASAWRGQGFSPRDASVWRRGGFTPEDASAARHAECAVSTAQEWIRAGIRPEDIAPLQRDGLQPGDVIQWQGTDLPASRIIDFRRLGVSPKEVLEWEAAGISAELMAGWKQQRLSLVDALDWSFTSPERARRLMARGMTAERARERAETGAARILDGQKSRSEAAEGEPALHSRGPIGPRPHPSPLVSVCGACSRPIQPSGKCGCT